MTGEIKEKKEEPKAKKPVYRKLTVKEQDMLLALFDKHNGNLSSMILDHDCLFKSRVQLAHYRETYGFQDKLAQIRTDRAKKVMASLEDSKIKALQIAQRYLEPQFHIVKTIKGVTVYDTDGNPVIVEKLPYYKEIKVAWEIIKAELGEPTEGIAILGAKDLAKKLDDILDDEESVKEHEDIPDHTTTKEGD